MQIAKTEKPTTKVHKCKCGCGQMHRPLPLGTWMSYISGWHRVRTIGVDGPDYSSEEIGAGNDPDGAVGEAWDWLEERMKRHAAGRCWYCNDDPKWKEDYYGEPPVCGSCKK